MSNEQPFHGFQARHWYADEFEFRQLCGDAQSQARSEIEQEFAAKMMIKANQHGLDTYLSPRQHAWLCRMADHDEPSLRPDMQRLGKLESDQP